MKATCPHCGQFIQDDWRVCPFCSNRIPSTAGYRPDPDRPNFMRRLLNFPEWILARAETFLNRFPVYRRLAPYLGFRQLWSYTRWISLSAIVIPMLLGLYPSRYGHIDTTPFIYQFMAIVSFFNPLLGFVGGLAFGVADFAEKLVTNQIYGLVSIGDYIGARIGYLISYSSVILMGVLPGLLARVFQRFANRITTNRVNARSGSGMGGSGSQISWIELAAGVVGGLVGGGLAARLAIPLNFPAFYLRPNPDVSCYNDAVSHLRQLIPAITLSGGAGPALDAGVRVLNPRGRSPDPSTTSTTGSQPPKTGPRSKSKTPTKPPGPTTDRIYDGKDAERVLKELNVYDDVKNLDPDDPDYWDKFDRILKTSKGGRKIVGTAFERGKDRRGPVNMDDIVIIVREPVQPPPPSPTKPPQKTTPPTQPPTQTPPTAKQPDKIVVPPDQPVEEKKEPQKKPDVPTPQELLDKWRKRLEEVRKRIRFLENELKKLDREYAKRFAQWELCWKSGLYTGLVDAADLFLSTITSKVSPKGFAGAAVKDSAKRGIKDAIQWYLKPEWLAKAEAQDAAQRRAGPKPGKTSDWFRDAFDQYIWKPIGFGFPPSGGMKQVFQNGVHWKAKRVKDRARRTGSKVLKKQYKNLYKYIDIFGWAESMKGLSEQANQFKRKCEHLRVQMNGIRNRQRNVRSALEDARMDEAEALAAVRANEKPIFSD